MISRAGTPKAEAGPGRLVAEVEEAAATKAPSSTFSTCGSVPPRMRRQLWSHQRSYRSHRSPLRRLSRHRSLYLPRCSPARTPLLGLGVATPAQPAPDREVVVVRVREPAPVPAVQSDLAQVAGRRAAILRHRRNSSFPRSRHPPASEDITSLPGSTSTRRETRHSSDSIRRATAATIASCGTFFCHYGFVPAFARMAPPYAILWTYNSFSELTLRTSD